MMHRSKFPIAMTALLWGTVSGCAIVPKSLPAAEKKELVQRAVHAVKQAVRYEHAGSIRAMGIEILQRHLGIDARPWVRLALQDKEPGVRFAALLAAGSSKDSQSEPLIRSLCEDPDPNLQLGAFYALHQLGDTQYAARMPPLLLNHPSPDVRRNTAFILGLIGEPGAVSLLARAMKDADDSVRDQALISMARLRNAEAIQQLTFSANSGDGLRRVQALNALAELDSKPLLKTFHYKLTEGEFIEVRLAAARGLGRLGNAQGFNLAMEALEFNHPDRSVPDDPPREQIMRVRQLAARAVGAIGDERALSALRRCMEDPVDPRIQLAAADAILEIAGPPANDSLPWADSGNRISPGDRP